MMGAVTVGAGEMLLEKGWQLVDGGGDGYLEIAAAGSEVISGSGELLEISFQRRDGFTFEDVIEGIEIGSLLLDESRARVRTVRSYEPSEERLVLALSQNFPNPFNPSTTIGFSVPEESDVEVSIFDVRGGRVRRLLDERKAGGRYSLIWDGLDDGGHELPSGVYFCRLSVGEFRTIKKMLMLK
jgi:hypothetical protein